MTPQTARGVVSIQHVGAGSKSEQTTVVLTTDERRWLLAKLQEQAGQQRPVGQLSLRQVLANKHVLILSVVLAGSTAVSSGGSVAAR